MIKKLPKEVINKIAAGEVIQRPYNVIKELVENSVDAEATQIRVTIINGGLTTIEVVDNGKGIRKGDFPLLCERFATSKIADLSDLETIASFGFRGQALASLSYVSQLQITSKHKDENIGYKCTFKDEKMMEQPEPISTNTGTKIKADHLFGNLQTRRSSLNPGQEKKKVLRLIQHFALHYHLIKFSVQSQKGQEFTTDSKGLSVSKSKMKVFQMITKLSYDKFTYLPKDILETIKIEAIITKLNTIKGKTLCLNVNNRIVENPEIFKLVERAYSECYQSIHQENEGFFVYLSLELDPKKIDCNQHPSKKTIGFFGADKIYENVFNWVLASIKEESSIKNIATNIITKNKPQFNINKNMVLNLKSQSMEPSQSNDNKGPLLKKPQENEGGSKTQMKDGEKPVYAYQKNRTDALQMPINYYVKTKQSKGSNLKELKFKLKPVEKQDQLSQNIKKFFQCITYVGCFNLNYIFIHMQSCLYLMNILPCLQAYIREWLQNNQLLIIEFLQDRERLDLRSTIVRFLKNKNLQGRIDVDSVIDKILINKYLLAREFGIGIEEKENSLEGKITSFPVFERFMADTLDQDELAYFLCRIFSKEPTSTQRENYFIQFLISYFEEHSGNEGSEGDKMELSPMNDIYSDYFRDKVIPVLKTKGRDYKEIRFTDCLTEMVNMKDVYKIFERC